MGKNIVGAVAVGMILLFGCQERMTSTGDETNQPDQPETTNPPGANPPGANESTPKPTPPAKDGCSVCGNGIVECGEVCDDGNRQTEACADRRLDPEARPGRTCGSDCRWTICRWPYCGDEILDLAAGEECDEGVATRTCDHSCKLTACGNEANLADFADDFDCDGLTDDDDNCPNTFNPDQVNSDSDPLGDACQPTGECAGGMCGTPEQSGGCGCGGGIPNDPDIGWTPNRADDVDADGYEDDFDNCPFSPNTDQTDTDGDGVGDACDPEDCPAECK